MLIGFVVLSLLFYPIASAGLNRTLHWLMADIESAVKDYHMYSAVIP